MQIKKSTVYYWTFIVVLYVVVICCYRGCRDESDTPGPGPEPTPGNILLTVKQAQDALYVIGIVRDRVEVGGLKTTEDVREALYGELGKDYREKILNKLGKPPIESMRDQLDVLAGSIEVIDATSDEVIDEEQFDDASVSAEAPYIWQDEIVWTEIPKQRDSVTAAQSRTPIFHDVYSYADSRAIWTRDTALTNIHETMHFIPHLVPGKNHLVNKFVYYKEGKGAFVKEPKLKTKEMYSYIPDRFKQKDRIWRWDTYLVRTTAKDRPNFPIVDNLYDAWNCYLTDSKAALEMYERSMIRGDSREIDGAMEFLVICSGALIAVHEKEPQFDDFKQLKAIHAMLVDKAREIIIPGLKTPMAEGESTIKEVLRDFLDYNINGKMLDGLKEIYGDAWFNEKILSLGR